MRPNHTKNLKKKKKFKSSKTCLQLWKKKSQPNKNLNFWILCVKCSIYIHTYIHIYIYTYLYIYYNEIIRENEIYSKKGENERV